MERSQEDITARKFKSCTVCGCLEPFQGATDECCWAQSGGSRHCNFTGQPAVHDGSQMPMLVPWQPGSQPAESQPDDQEKPAASQPATGQPAASQAAKSQGQYQGHASSTSSDLEKREPAERSTRDLALEILCFGDTETLTRPCVDCGRYTGRYCDYCLAANRIPSETWAPGQATPLCSSCDGRYDKCHYCRGIHMARPFAWGPRA